MKNKLTSVHIDKKGDGQKEGAVGVKKIYEREIFQVADDYYCTSTWDTGKHITVTRCVRRARFSLFTLCPYTHG